MFPAFAHFRRTATLRHRARRAARSARATRSSCGTCPPTATRPATRTPTASTCAATPSTRRSAPAAGTSASAPRSPGWSCNVMFEETLRALSGDGARRAQLTLVESGFINQLKTLPVTLGPRQRVSRDRARRRPGRLVSATRPRATARRDRRSSARITCMTALISARCVNACGKLPRWRPVMRVDLLGVEAERAGVAEQPLAQRPGAVELADLAQRRDQPERADQERALLALQAVVGLLGAVAQDEAVLGQLVGDRDHGGADPLVVGRQEAHQRQQQQRRRRAPSVS